MAGNLSLPQHQWIWSPLPVKTVANSKRRHQQTKYIQKQTRLSHYPDNVLMMGGCLRQRGLRRLILLSSIVKKINCKL